MKFPGVFGENTADGLYSPWRIGTLKYLEIEIKKWPSGARRGKWGQIGTNGTKQDQIGPNVAKWGQTGSIRAKRG